MSVKKGGLMRMEITITINAPELSSAIQALAAALSGQMVGATYDALEATVEATVQEENQSAATPIENTYALEQVRAKLADLARGGKRAEVKALLNKLGAKKLTEVPKERYPELMKEAEAI